jgi:hypothetical protein
MKKFALLCLLGFSVLAAPATAATANFQGICDGFPMDCIFDPQRTPSGQTGTACPGSSIKRYFWDFGDGSSTFKTPPPHQTGHTYSGSILTDVCLTVFCNDNTNATTCHCVSNTVGLPYCILVGAGWGPP